MTLVLRKLLASSTFAIAGALESLANKLEQRLREDNQFKTEEFEEELQEDFEHYSELADELELENDNILEPLTLEERKAMTGISDAIAKIVKLTVDKLILML